MRTHGLGSRGETVVHALVAGGLVLGWLLWLGDVGFNLQDEGFLWYGSWRVGFGDVPHRDFQSYEPGRYYWSAWVGGLFGDGLLGLRAAVAVFFAGGLFVGLEAARRADLPLGLRIALAATAVAWAFPRHKLFEPALVFACIFVAIRLAERPDRRRHIEAGAFVGLTLLLGRNHTLYGALAIGVMSLWALWRRDGLPLLRSAPALVVGGLLGALPFLGMMLLVDGFAASFVESVVFFATRGSNHPLPIPWLWRVLGSGREVALGQLAVSLTFTLAPLLALAGAWIAWKGDASRAAVRGVAACTCVGLFYFHHASVRSDASHLAQMVPAILLGAACLPGALRAGWIGHTVAWAVIGSLSLAVATGVNPHVVEAARGHLVAHRIGDDELRLEPGLARSLGGFREVVPKHVGADEELLILPYGPGLYPILGKASPLRSIYLLWPGTPLEQKAMIDRLEERGVDWVLVGSTRLRQSHPAFWAHLKEHFRRVEAPRIAPALLLRREDDAS